MVFNVFLIANCYENYSIVSNTIIRMWLTQALINNKITNPTIKTYYDHTPIQVYGGLSPNEGNFGPFIASPAAKFPLPSGEYSSQYTNFIWIIALTAVSLARVSEADMVVVVANGVTLIPTHCVLATIAQVLNKDVVFWNDDLRCSWGSSNDLVTMGMTVTPYKYLWGTQAAPNIGTTFNIQKRGNLPGSMPTPHQGNTVNCKPEDPDKPATWGELSTSIAQIIAANKEEKSSVGNLSSRLKKLVALGQIIIKDIEGQGGGGWKNDLGRAWPMFYLLNYIINYNQSYLSKKEQEFISKNAIMDSQTQEISPVLISKPNKNVKYELCYPPYAVINSIKSGKASDRMFKAVLSYC